MKPQGGALEWAYWGLVVVLLAAMAVLSACAAMREASVGDAVRNVIPDRVGFAISGSEDENGPTETTGEFNFEYDLSPRVVTLDPSERRWWQRQQVAEPVLAVENVAAEELIGELLSAVGKHTSSADELVEEFRGLREDYRKVNTTLVGIEDETFLDDLGRKEAVTGLSLASIAGIVYALRMLGLLPGAARTARRASEPTEEE